MNKLMVVLLLLAPLLLGAVKTSRSKSPKGARVIVDTGRPTSAFDCDTPKAVEWYGSESRCRRDLCPGANRSNAHVRGPDGRLRGNPCYYQLPQ